MVFPKRSTSLGIASVLPEATGLPESVAKRISELKLVRQGNLVHIRKVSDGQLIGECLGHCELMTYELLKDLIMLEAKFCQHNYDRSLCLKCGQWNG